MAPRPRTGWTPGVTPHGSREGAGLLLVYPRPAPTVLLTLRRSDLSVHAGQVSLPGGAVEPGEDALAAALREAEEEVGVDPSLIRPQGELTPLHIPASGFILRPIVATLREPPRLRPSEVEVERLLEVPLTDLQDRHRLRIERRQLLGQDSLVPYFDLSNEKVWGATAMVLAEFLSLLGRPPDPWC